jgi:hypothetical protein
MTHVALAFKDGFLMHHDFATGGTSITTIFQNPVTIRQSSQYSKKRIVVNFLESDGQLKTKMEEIGGTVPPVVEDFPAILVIPEGSGWACWTKLDIQNKHTLRLSLMNVVKCMDYFKHRITSIRFDYFDELAEVRKMVGNDLAIACRDFGFLVEFDLETLQTRDENKDAVEVVSREMRKLGFRGKTG